MKNKFLICELRAIKLKMIGFEKRLMLLPVAATFTTPTISLVAAELDGIATTCPGRPFGVSFEVSIPIMGLGCL